MHEHGLGLDHGPHDLDQARRTGVEERAVHLGERHVVDEERGRRPEKEGRAERLDVEAVEAARFERDLVVGAQVDDAAHAELAERRAPGRRQAGEVAGAEQHAAAGASPVCGEPSDITEVQRTVDRDARTRHHGALAARSPRRGGTGYLPAIVMRLNALIETSSQLSATYSCSLRMPPTWSYSSSDTPSSWM